MSRAARRRFAFAALLAVVVALPVAAVPQVTMSPEECGRCPLMAARLAAHAAAPHAAGTGFPPCHRPASQARRANCCAAAPGPAVPLGEAAPPSPSAPQVVALAVQPATPGTPAVLAGFAAVPAAAPDPPGRGLYLLFSSLLN